MLAGNWDECLEIAKAQIRDGAHLLDLCIDYVGRDGGVADMTEATKRLATASTLPIVLDSTEPEVIRAGLEHLAGRCVINSVNYEDGDGPNSRFQRVMPLVREHGAAVVALTIDEEGQARTADWKVRVASRLIEDLSTNWGDERRRRHRRHADLPDRHRAGGDPPRRPGNDRGDPSDQGEVPAGAHHPGGVSNVSFGLNPAARIVLNSVFLHECVEAGLDSAIVHAAKIRPMNRIPPEEQRQVALDMVYDRRREGYDPLQTFLQMFEGVTTADEKAARAAEMAALPVAERLKQRIVDGADKGLEADLDEAMADKAALDIVNDDLLAGMKVVGELFGSGQMQLPFVLQSAEVMKKAVAYLEPHMEKSDDTGGKGTIVLATVKGDVHDIGKNLVDIILSNNGFNVVNLGIKQPVQAIIDAAQEHNADVIGMSGLLVKSTVVMKENLSELAAHGMADRFPVLLGGAALTRAYVEQDLRQQYPGEVRYAKDAFEGLQLMDTLMAIKRGGIRTRCCRRCGNAGCSRSTSPPKSCRSAPSARMWPVASTCPPRRSGALGWSRGSSWPTSSTGSTNAPPSWAAGA